MFIGNNACENTNSIDHEYSQKLIKESLESAIGVSAELRNLKLVQTILDNTNNVINETKHIKLSSFIKKIDLVKKGTYKWNFDTKSFKYLDDNKYNIIILFPSKEDDSQLNRKIKIYDFDENLLSNILPTKLKLKFYYLEEHIFVEEDCIEFNGELLDNEKFYKLSNIKINCNSSSNKFKFESMLNNFGTFIELSTVVYEDNKKIIDLNSKIAGNFSEDSFKHLNIFDSNFDSKTEIQNHKINTVDIIITIKEKIRLNINLNLDILKDIKTEGIELNNALKLVIFDIKNNLV